MKLNLNLIRNLYKIKLLQNLIITKNNFNFFEPHYIKKNKLLVSENNINYIITIKNFNILSNDLLLNSFKFTHNINNYINLNIELLTLLQYRNFSKNYYYSNYDMSMLYTLSLLNDDTESIFDLDSNSVINVRKPYKSSNETLLKKTTLLDAILKKYIETSLETKVSLNFDKYAITFVKKKSIFLKVLRRRMRRISRLLYNSGISLRTFIRVTFIFMCTKDLDIFSKMLLKVMDSMHYKNHRRFLYYLKLFITKSMNFYFEVLKFEGFFFYLSGKISGGGNSKKKRYVVKHGKYSLTNKMLKLKYKKGLIHTKTGVMGYKFMVSYK